MILNQRCPQDKAVEFRTEEGTDRRMGWGPSTDRAEEGAAFVRELIEALTACGNYLTAANCGQGRVVGERGRSWRRTLAAGATIVPKLDSQPVQLAPDCIPACSVLQNCSTTGGTDESRKSTMGQVRCDCRRDGEIADSNSGLAGCRADSIGLRI